jgi:hypothetical protein
MRRRVPHILGAYFAGGWILLEFTDWAVGRWVLSPHITDFVVTAWLLARRDATAGRASRSSVWP